MGAVDLDRYPLDQLGSDRYRALAEQSASGFRDDGVALLPRFLTEDGLGQIVEEAERLVAHAFFCRNDHNVYLDDGDSSASADSAQNRRLRTDVGSIANDFLDPDGALQQLYDSEWLAPFVAKVVGAPELFQSSDPLGALSINVFAPGDAHAWHFDESLFTITLMVQEAESGGYFEYVTGLRTDDVRNHDGVQSVLDGDESHVKRLAFSAGTLSIFRGRHTMHRVTEVEGTRHRLVPVLTFGTEPGYQNSPEVRELFWGRT